MFSLTLYLPHELAQDPALAAAGSGRPRAEIIRRALGEHLERRERAWFIGEYAREAAGGCAHPALRHEAIRLAGEVVATVDEALEHVETLRPGERSWRLVAIKRCMSVRNRLLGPSEVVTAHLRTVEGRRISDGPLISLTAAEMQSVEQAFRAVFALGLV